MSDFYAQLAGGNVRLPDTNINGGGPLPTTLSGVTGINGDPDGQYNFNSDLLSGITPYAFGQGRMGSDRSYQQVPHRMQKIIPKLYLPYADFEHSESLLSLSHAVDQGDVAFILNSDRVQTLLFDSVQIRDASVYKMQIPNRAAFINISTVNYLLARLQRVSATCKPDCTWVTLAQDLGYNYHDTGSERTARIQLLKLVSTRFLPFGICAGSEKQGGQNETGLAPVQAAANHVSTLTVDGQNRDLVNVWRHTDLSAGDQLIYVLKWLPTHSYTLNHYYKGTAHQTFTNQKYCWQLVPDKFSMSDKVPVFDEQTFPYDYRIHGYWRIGQTFQHRGSYEAGNSNVADDMSYMRGQLLQITFAPVWLQHQEICDGVDCGQRKALSTHSMSVHRPLKAVKKQKRDFFAENLDEAGDDLPLPKMRKYTEARVPEHMKRWKVYTTAQDLRGIGIEGMFTCDDALAAPSPGLSLPSINASMAVPLVAGAVPRYVSFDASAASPSRPQPGVASMDSLQSMLEQQATPQELDEMLATATPAAPQTDPAPAPAARPKVRVNKPKKVPNED